MGEVSTTHHTPGFEGGGGGFSSTQRSRYTTPRRRTFQVLRLFGFLPKTAPEEKWPLCEFRDNAASTISLTYHICIEFHIHDEKSNK